MAIVAGALANALAGPETSMTQWDILTQEGQAGDQGSKCVEAMGSWAQSRRTATCSRSGLELMLSWAKGRAGGGGSTEPCVILLQPIGCICQTSGCFAYADVAAMLVHVLSAVGRCRAICSDPIKALRISGVVARLST